MSNNYLDDTLSSHNEEETAASVVLKTAEVDIAAARMDGNITKLSDAQLRFDEILNATSDALDKRNEVDTKYLSEALVSLGESANAVVSDFELISQLNSAEQGVIDDHALKLEQAKKALKSAAIEADEAVNGSFWSRVTSNKTKIEEDVAFWIDAVKQLESQTSNIELHAYKLMTDRLYAYKLEESLEEYNRKTKIAENILERHAAATKERLDDPDNGILMTLNLMRVEHETSGHELDRLKSSLGNIEQSIADKKQTIAETEGLGDISQLKSELDELVAEKAKHSRDTKSALTTYNASEKNIEELKIDKLSQLKNLSTIEVDLAKLRIDRTKLQTTMRSRLNTMKVMIDVKMNGELHDIEAKIAESNITFQAMSSTVADQATMEKFRKHPEQMRKVIETRRAQIDQDKNTVDEMDAFLTNIESSKHEV